MQIWFVVGCGRSGTTFLASELSKYEGIIALPEAQFFIESLIIEAEKGYEVAREFYLSHWRFRKNWSSSDTAKQLTADSILEFHEKVCLMEAGGNVAVCVDHTPTNAGYVWLIEKKIPDAKIINLIRDGRAVFASGKKTDWGEQNPYHAAVWWMAQVANARSLDHSLVVKYENLVSNPQTEIPNILTLMGQIGDHLYTDSTTMVLPRYTQRQHELVGKAADASRVDSWKKELPLNEIREYESIASNVLLSNGYELIFPSGVIRRQGYKRYLHWIYYARKKPINKIRALLRRVF